MVDNNEENSFFSRWSYRKALADEAKDSEADRALKTKQEEQRSLNANLVEGTGALPLSVSDSVENRETLSPEEEKEIAENLAAAEAVDLETLDYKSDYQVFFKKGVPEQLKNLAMRKLWISNPVLANVDGLNDYDENFGDPALNTFKSIWEVGRGYLTDEDKHTPVKEAVSSLADPEEIATENDLNDQNEPLENDETAEETELDNNPDSDTDSDPENDGVEAFKNQENTGQIAAENIELESDLVTSYDAEESFEMPEQKRVSIRSRLFENE